MSAPASEADVAEAVASAKGPLRITGGGTRLGLGQPVDAAPLRLSGLRGVSLHEPAALTLVARAGTPLAEIEALLDASGQRLPFEPMDHRALLATAGEPTIGGVVAGNISGPRRIQAGACRDFLLGLRFVDGTGNVVKSGGRVMKNVTGLDLGKLLSGSFGTLGVLTEVALKVLPKPEALADVVLRGLPDDRAISALAQALGSPFEASGAAHLPDAGLTLIRVEGFAASVAYRCDRLCALLAGFGAAEIRRDESAVAENWRQIRDAKAFASRPGTVWRVSLKPSQGPALVAAVAAELPGTRAFYDWGGGLVWLLVPGEDAGQAALIRAALASLGSGHATLVRGPASLRRAVPVFQPQAAEIERISAGLRAKFDPRGILNPGLMTFQPVPVISP